jgi:hypothetical protein
MAPWVPISRIIEKLSRYSGDTSFAFLQSVCLPHPRLNLPTCSMRVWGFCYARKKYLLSVVDRVMPGREVLGSLNQLIGSSPESTKLLRSQPGQRKHILR